MRMDHMIYNVEVDVMGKPVGELQAEAALKVSNLPPGHKEEEPS